MVLNILHFLHNCNSLPLAGYNLSSIQVFVMCLIFS
jgi:hypothetical protein